MRGFLDTAAGWTMPGGNPIAVWIGRKVAVCQARLGAVKTERPAPKTTTSWLEWDSDTGSYAEGKSYASRTIIPCC